jgi:hypothetical protein
VSPVEHPEGRGSRSQIIRRRESLAPYKSFNTLCLHACRGHHSSIPERNSPAPEKQRELLRNLGKVFLCSPHYGMTGLSILDQLHIIYRVRYIECHAFCHPLYNTVYIIPLRYNTSYHTSTYTCQIRHPVRCEFSFCRGKLSCRDASFCKR